MKPLITALGICAFLLAGNAAVADPDTHTWDDEDLDNSYWSSGDNWDPDQVPASCDNTTITLSGTTSIYDSNMSDTTFGVLTIGNNTSAVTLQVDKSGLCFGSGSIVGSTNITGSNDVSVSSSCCSGTGILSVDVATATLSVASGRTVSVGTLSIDADSPNAATTLTKTGSGTISCGTLSIQGGDSAGETATLTLPVPGTVSSS